MDSKITKSLMDSGADSMIPNIANKESAFHYCGQSGNAAVIIILKIIIATSLFIFIVFIIICLSATWPETNVFLHRNMIKTNSFYLVTIV